MISTSLPANPIFVTTAPGADEDEVASSRDAETLFSSSVAAPTMAATLSWISSTTWDHRVTGVPLITAETLAMSPTCTSRFLSEAARS